MQTLASQTMAMKKELLKIQSNYEDRRVVLSELEQKHQELEKEAAEKTVSTKEVQAMLSQKIREFDQRCKDTEKKYYKEQALDTKAFVAQFMKDRVQYHTIQIYKAKVNA